MKMVIIIPTHNEEIVIENNLQTLLSFLAKHFSNDNWQVVVADNASVDQTRTIVSELVKNNSRLSLWTTEKKGKGYALRQALMLFPAEVSIFMDADLAADLDGLFLLVEALKTNDLAVGSRFVQGSQVERRLLRALVSHGYSLLAKRIYKSQINDFQCGFKAMNQHVVNEIVMMTEDNAWLFDTELLVLAERAGMKIQEIPITWIETRDKRRKSSVKFFRTFFDHGREIWALRKRLSIPR